MCGIITLYHPKKNVSTTTLLRYYIQQCTRGQRGFGFSYMTDKGIVKTMRFVHESACFMSLAHVETRLLMFHHRQPTSTANRSYQNHPIVQKGKTGIFHLAHNGIIMNAEELIEDHYKDVALTTKTKEDDTRKSTHDKFNDSEALLLDLMDHMENESKLKASGSIAFCMIETDKRFKFRALHYGRNERNPLIHMTLDDGTVIVSSENEESKVEHEVKPMKLHTVRFPTKGKAKTSIATLPLYIAPIVVHKRYDSSKYDSGAWESWTDHDGGTHWQKSVRVEKGKAINPKHEALQNYLDVLKLALVTVEECSTLDTVLSLETDISEALREIDELTREVTQTSVKAFGKVSRNAKSALESLRKERTRLLPNRSAFHGVLSMFSGSRERQSDVAMKLLEMENAKD